MPTIAGEDGKPMDFSKASLEEMKATKLAYDLGQKTAGKKIKELKTKVSSYEDMEEVKYFVAKKAAAEKAKKDDEMDDEEKAVIAERKAAVKSRDYSSILEPIKKEKGD